MSDQLSSTAAQLRFPHYLITYKKLNIVPKLKMVKNLQTGRKNKSYTLFFETKRNLKHPNNSKTFYLTTKIRKQR